MTGKNYGSTDSFRAIALMCLTMFLAGVLPGCKGKTEQVDGNGTIEAIEVDVTALQSGILKKIHVREGDRVSDGMLLAEIDSEIIEIRLEQAESRVVQAKAQLDLLRQGPHPEDLKQAQAGERQAAEQLELARKEWERIRKLFSEGTVTAQRYDAGEAEYRIARARHEGASASLEKMKNLARPQELRSAEETVRQAEQGAEIIRRNLEDCMVKAPRDGVISEIYFEEGEVIGTGRPVMTLRDPELVYVTVYLPEPLLAQISIGEAAEIHIDGYGGKYFSGRISHISGEAEFTPKNVQTREQRVKLVYAVKVNAVNEGGVLKPGMPADVVLVSGDE